MWGEGQKCPRPKKCPLTIEKNRSYTSLSWDYYKRSIVIFWFRMYWCSSRQERETGIEKNQKNFSHTLLIKQWHALILYKPKFLLIRKRKCRAREKFLLFFSMPWPKKCPRLKNLDIPSDRRIPSDGFLHFLLFWDIPSKNFWSKRLKKGWNLRPKSGSNDSFLGPTLSPGSKLGRAKWPRLSRFLVPTLSPGQNFNLSVPT